MQIRFLLALSVSLLLGCKTPDDRAQARIDELVRENGTLRSQVEVLEQRLERIQRSFDGGGVSFGPPLFYQPQIDGTLLDVHSESRMVILDRGERDGVKHGYVFDVYRGSTYKGQVRIQDVQETMSTGLILHEKNPIARGDSVTTNL